MTKRTQDRPPAHPEGPGVGVGDQLRTEALGLGAVVAALEAGAVVAIPTDTVYGLAVDPTRPGATSALFALKSRPEELDLPVLVGSIEQAEALAGPDGFPAPARRLAHRFWPGPLTIVVPRRRGLDWDLGAHAQTIGLRLPDHAVVRTLCDEVGALATTSANLHGEPPCTDADAVERAFDSRVVVFDGGRCAGAPSTVVSVLGEDPKCLREGAVAWADVLAIVGRD
ncbi:MAG TPA: L-threonylcarbamoyladenylate synthase [Acidimicrobiales bacterium]|nr:L-threonylcarbamoyladenylate synthase [Acidimicrobiales bacterium]